MDSDWTWSRGWSWNHDRELGHRGCVEHVASQEFHGDDHGTRAGHLRSNREAHDGQLLSSGKKSIVELLPGVNHHVSMKLRLMPVWKAILMPGLLAVGTTSPMRLK